MEEIKIPEKMKNNLNNLMQTKNIAESNLNIYLQGCMDGLGLEGDWNLDTKNWTLVRKEVEDGAMA